nr:glucokinase [Pararoseomonas baculiformis]
MIADVGGTNARFAVCEPGGAPVEERKLSVAEYPGLVDAALAYLGGRSVEEAVFAVATPVLGDEVAFTNSPWRFNIPEAQARLGLRRLVVINDFVAQASAIRGLGAEDLRPLKPGRARAGRPRVVIGPGTGLGVAFLVGDGESARVLSSEAGHASFSPQDERQARLLEALRPEFGHVSTERLLSGPGLLRIANGVAAMDGHDLRFSTPPEVTERAKAGDCPVCQEALRIFAAILGATAGDLVLTLMAEGGVYVTGGLCRNMGPLLDPVSLHQGFTAKGRFSAYLEAVPITQVIRPHTGLLGAAIHQGD